MKKLQKLKLFQLSKNELETKQMISLKGGYECSCSCNCQFSCSCTPYPPGGQSNSQSVSDFYSQWNSETDGTVLMEANRDFLNS